MQAVLIFVIANFILFVPIFLSNYFVLDFNCKKLYFNVCVFGVSVFGGYITIKDKTAYLHYCNKKAVKIDLEEILFKKGRSFNFKGIQTYGIQSQARCGFLNCNLLNILCAIMIINQELAPVILNKRPYFKIRNDVIINCCEDFIVIFKIGLFFNIFALLNLFLSGLIKRMVKNGKRKK